MPKLVIDREEVYELKEAADLLHIGIATLFRWMRDGKIVPLRISKRTFIPQSEVKRLKNEGARSSVG